MDLFRNLRLRWNAYMLKKRLGQLNVERSSIRFEQTKRIGILFDATNLDNQVFVCDMKANILHMECFDERLEIINNVRKQQKEQK